MAGVSSRFSFATATTIQWLKNSSNNESTLKSTTLWLSVWKKWCLENGIAEEIENFEQTQLNTSPERFYAEIKSKHDYTSQTAIPFHRKWFGHKQVLELFSRTLNFLCPKDVKISLYIIVLIVRGCFDRTQGLNKLFFHLMRALCFSTIMISYLIFFQVCY